MDNFGIVEAIKYYCTAMFCLPKYRYSCLYCGSG